MRLCLVWFQAIELQARGAPVLIWLCSGRISCVVGVGSVAVSPCVLAISSMLAMQICPVDSPAAKSSGRVGEGDHEMHDTLWPPRSRLTARSAGLTRVRANGGVRGWKQRGCLLVGLVVGFLVYARGGSN